jgi:hypothetical protein
MKTSRLPFATVGYVAVLASTTVVQHVVSARSRHRLLMGSSTDIAHLSRDPLLVLLASAFWLPDTAALLLSPFVVVVLIAGERRFGTRLMVGTFVVGHVLATLLTEAAVAIGVHAGWLSTTHESRLDVGPSYGAAAVLGLLVASLPGAWRRAGYGGLVVLLGVPLTFDSELTTVGHIVAAAIGVVLWWVPWVRRSRVVRGERQALCRRGSSSVSHC